MFAQGALIASFPPVYCSYVGQKTLDGGRVFSLSRFSKPNISGIYKSIFTIFTNLN